MKTIYFLRHAKAEKKEGMADFDRPLAERGLGDSQAMGKFLKMTGCIPERIFTSPAKRARQTAELAAAACGCSNKLEAADELYKADGIGIVKFLRRLDDGISTAMVVGHNPAVEDAAKELSDASGGAFEIPTAGLVCLEADVEKWKNVSRGTCAIRWFVIPQIVRADCKTTMTV